MHQPPLRTLPAPYPKPAPPPATLATLTCHMELVTACTLRTPHFSIPFCEHRVPPCAQPLYPLQARSAYTALAEQLEAPGAQGPGGSARKVDFTAALTALFKDVALCLEVRM